MMEERLTNGRTLYGLTGNHQVTDLECSGQTHIQGPILRSIDGASICSCNSAIQSLIIQSNSINFDNPLPLFFCVLFIDNAQPCRLCGPGLCTKTCSKLCSTYRQPIDTLYSPVLISTWFPAHCFSTNWSSLSTCLSSDLFCPIAWDSLSHSKPRSRTRCCS